MVFAYRFIVSLLVLAIPSSMFIRDRVTGETQTSIHQDGVAELLALHQAERQTHFDHDSAALITRVAPELLDVRDGQINRMRREDVRKRFGAYFRNAEFSAWDDVEPPIVRVSPDGQMGWMIVRVRINYTETNESGKRIGQQSTGAWMSAYEKKDGKWTMVAVTPRFLDMAPLI